MHVLNLWSAWIGILAGMLVGAGLGLGFQRPGWMGGYGAWSRRLSRLGHISFFGLAFVNIAFFLTVDRLADPSDGLATSLRAASLLLIAGAATMPVVCFLAAWREGWRHAFLLPVACLVGGVSSLLFWGVMS